MKYYKTDVGYVATIGKLDFPQITKDEYDKAIAEFNERNEAQAEQLYWQNISYEDAVDMKIREKYTASQEFAILRQKDEKPEEYQTYYNYCEECKAFVKAKKGIE